MKKICVLMLGFIMLFPMFCHASGERLIVNDNFEDYGQMAEWNILSATDTYMKIERGEGVEGNVLKLTDKNENKASPNYEGYITAERYFGKQPEKVVIEFYAKSDNIPIAHEKISICAGSETVNSIVFNNHGQNSHVLLSDRGESHMLTRQYKNVWNKFKFVMDIKKRHTALYVDNMDVPVKEVEFEYDAEYVDRIIFATGRDLGESSVLWIDELKIYGTHQVESLTKAVSEKAGNSLTVNAEHDSSTGVLKISGVNSGSISSPVAVVVKNNDNMDNLFQCRTDENGKFSIAYVPVAKDGDVFKVTVSSDGLKAEADCVYKPDKAPVVVINPRYAMITTEVGTSFTRTVDGKEEYDGNVIWNTSNKVIGYVSASGENNVQILGRESGEFNVTATTETLNAMTDTVRVLVNDKNIDIVTEENAYIMTLPKSENDMWLRSNYAQIRIPAAEAAKIAEDSVKVRIEKADTKELWAVSVTGAGEGNVQIMLPYWQITGKYNEELLSLALQNADGSISLLPTKIDKTLKNASAWIKGDCTVILTELGVRFDDIGNSFAKNEIGLLAGRGVLDYNSSNNFNPAKSVLRQEFAYALAKHLGLSEAVYKNVFADVSADSIYAGYIQALYDKGIMIGDGKSFNGNSKLTRQEACTIFARAFDIKQAAERAKRELEAFTDGEKVADWAREAVGAMITSGIVKGTTATTVSPETALTNEQMASLLIRISK